ncbi:MAG TPA: hypothetical protein VGM41_17090 [Chitinophagaceae bacterium]
MAKSILVVKYGCCDNYVFDLCTELNEKGFKVSLLLVHDKPHFRKPVFDENYRKLLVFVDCIYVHLDKDILAFPLQKMCGLLHRLNTNYHWFTVSPLLVAKVKKAIRHRVKDFSSIIIFDQQGLYLAGRAITKSFEKVLYFSLEIYTPENPHMRSGGLRGLVAYELAAIARCKALIIQDELRARALLSADFEKLKDRIIYLPVSVREQQHPEKSGYLFEKYGIPKDKKLLLYYGSLYKGRGVELLLEAFRDYNDPGSVLFFHGYKKDAALPEGDNIRVSSELVNFDEIYKIITSCHIGFAIYPNDDLNNRLTGFSSEKVARYTQCGVPFIALRNESYEKLQREFLCCELMDDFSQLAAAVQKINAAYDTYRTNAFMAFNTYFDFNVASRPLMNFLAAN